MGQPLISAKFLAIREFVYRSTYNIYTIKSLPTDGGSIGTVRRPSICNTPCPIRQFSDLALKVEQDNYFHVLIGDNYNHTLASIVAYSTLENTFKALKSKQID